MPTEDFDYNPFVFSGPAIYVKSFPVATARYGKAHADLYSDGLWRAPRMTHEIDLCRDLVRTLNNIVTPDITVSSAEQMITEVRLHMYSLACFQGADFRILPFGEGFDEAMLEELGVEPGEIIPLEPDLGKKLPGY